MAVIDYIKPLPLGVTTTIPPKMLAVLRDPEAPNQDSAVKMVGTAYEMLSEQVKELILTDFSGITDLTKGQAEAKAAERLCQVVIDLFLMYDFLRFRAGMLNVPAKFPYEEILEVATGGSKKCLTGSGKYVSSKEMAKRKAKKLSR